jgi:fructose-1,6-bisphosphatase/inositol monophosphatase family enzyme
MTGDGVRHRSVVRDVLRTAYEAYSSTSADERRTVEDTAADFTTRVDRRLTGRIEDCFAAQEPEFTVLSEEQETVTRPESGPIAIVDEVDGTANLAKGNGDLPFGTVVAIADVADPTFDEVVAMGYLVLPRGDLYEAYRGEGATLTQGWIADDGVDETRETSALGSTGRRSVAGSPPDVLVDQYMLADRPDLAEPLWSMGYPGDFRSLCHHLTLVARGSYDVAVSGDYCRLHEAKRATAEELAGAYRLLVESGGAVTDWEGEPLDGTRIGFADGDTHDVVAAATEELAREVAGRL